MPSCTGKRAGSHPVDSTYDIDWQWQCNGAVANAQRQSMALNAWDSTLVTGISCRNQEAGACVKVHYLQPANVYLAMSVAACRPCCQAAVPVVLLEQRLYV